MSWQLYLVLSSILGIIRDTFTKKISQKIDPLLALFYFYLTAIAAASFIAVFFYHTNPFSLDSPHHLARLFGIGFGLGVYGMFSAIKISLVKTQVFGNYRSLVSIILAGLFLSEFRQLNFSSLLSLIIFILSLTLPFFQGRLSPQDQKTNRHWTFWMLLNIILIGSGLFFIKLFTRSLLPIDILVNQYLGSFFIISLIITIRNLGLVKSLPPLSLRVADTAILRLTLFNGIITAFSLFFLYQSLSLGQVTVVTQVDNFARTILLIPIGLFLFGEHRQMKTVDYISFILALFGAVLLMFFV